MLPKADRYLMQETYRYIRHYEAYKFYPLYMKEAIISAIILSYLTTSNCKFETYESKKLIDFTPENYIACNIYITYIFTIKLSYKFFRQYTICNE